MTVTSFETQHRRAYHVYIQSFGAPGIDTEHPVPFRGTRRAVFRRHAKYLYKMFAVKDPHGRRPLVEDQGFLDSLNALDRGLDLGKPAADAPTEEPRSSPAPL